MPSQLEKNSVASNKKRGPYRTASAGQLPKRRSESSIEKLAQKSAERGKKLEYLTQALKRRDDRITELEKVLEVASHMARRKSEEEDLLLKQLENASAQIDSLMADLQHTQRENYLLNIKVESNSTASLSVPFKKKGRWVF